MLRTMLLAALLAPTLTLEASADVLPPGYKGVNHVITFEVAEGAAGYTFLLYPTYVGEPSDSTVSVVVPGQPVSFYKLVSPRIYAVTGPAPALDTLTRDWFEDPERPRSELELHQVAAVPDSDPTATIETVYRITGVEGTAVRVEEDHEVRLDADGTPIGEGSRLDRGALHILLGLSGTITLILVAVLAIRTRRRRDRARAAPAG